MGYVVYYNRKSHRESLMKKQEFNITEFEWPYEFPLGRRLSEIEDTDKGRTFAQIIGEEETPLEKQKNENHIGRFALYIFDYNKNVKRLYLVGNDIWDMISQMTEIAKNNELSRETFSFFDCHIYDFKDGTMFSGVIKNIIKDLIDSTRGV